MGTGFIACSAQSTAGLVGQLGLPADDAQGVAPIEYVAVVAFAVAQQSTGDLRRPLQRDGVYGGSVGSVEFGQ